MSRVNLTDGSWFNPEIAERFAEDTRWNGTNRISIATGSQWDHEELYRTKTGRWILHAWSQWQGTVPTYEEISDSRARTWLLRNKEDAAVERFFPGAIAAAEI